ncbi:MAG: SMI1/KNR4 family protein [Verrucomicrobiota bacterium]
MHATPQSIWQVPAYLPYLQPPITDELVREAEREIGFKLPSSYLALLKTQNGGYIRFGLPDSVHEMIYGIGPNFPSITGVDWEEVKESVTMQLDGLIPFDGDGHWHLCIDYRKNVNKPCVSYVDVECDSESKVADSFEEYLQMLELNVEENEFVIPSVSDIESVKSKLSSLLRVKFEAPDTYDSGYPIERARLGSARDPEWIWISPNLVSRGFVREDDSRYQELRELMPGQAKRYPELPESSYILSATDKIRSKVLDAIQKASIEIRPLADYFPSTQ